MAPTRPPNGKARDECRGIGAHGGGLFSNSPFTHAETQFQKVAMDGLSPANAAEPLYQVKLLGALRNGDSATIHELLTEIRRDRRRNSQDGSDLGAAALHLAIRCASTDTIALLLSNRAISPNAVYPPGSGTTPLHLAASIGRADVVNLLLEQEGIDDTLQDTHGRTCKDVAHGKEVHKAIRDSRSLLTASYRSLLHSYIASSLNQGPPQGLIDILRSPRARLIDLSYLDPTTGRSLLHEAAQRRDLSLIDLSIKAGADVFVRDKRGKSVIESVHGSKDDKVRVFLRQFTNYDSSLIEQPPTSAEQPFMKGYLSKYTNVAKGYNTRWFVLKNGILSYYRHQDDEQVASRGSIAMKSAMLRYAPAVDKLRFEIYSAPGRGQQKWYIKGSHQVEVGRWTQAISRSIELARREAGSSQTQSGSESESSSFRKLGANLRSSFSSQFSSQKINKNFASSPSIHDSLEDNAAVASGSDSQIEEMEGREDEDERADDSSDATSQRIPPYETEFTLHGNSTAAQVELTAQLLASFTLPATASQESRDIHAALTESTQVAARMIGEYVRMVSEREEWWREKLARERARGALWEESLQIVVKEGAALEEELKNRARARRRSGRISVDGTGRTIMDLGRSTIRMRGSVYGGVPSGTLSPPFHLHSPPGSGLPVVTVQEPIADEWGVTTKQLHEPPTAALTEEDLEDMVSTDEEDEFFDAIESNQLPNVVIPEALVKPSPIIETPLIDIRQYDGYKELRRRLPIDKDNRPPTSLWSVLKHSIGKDLTRISLPVFFNEPTSMLQRMAEDMEFSECLDAAASEPDPHKRIAFVAAFAMSNYSSTYGRIAKPFNPMLSETFEYVRLDKSYRYVSEQVSHHPPMSACWAESPSWHYFGEVDAQNKFMGKSFEIRPTGVAHAELIIPEEFGPGYPKATGPMAKGKVVEHYSWKKVTSCVSGFILGSPTIDHYGDMTVRNHRTGDTCTLTFKPRGWRGKDAYEIFGQVMDAQGNVTYEIAGRWTSQLVARAVGTGYGALHPDVTVDACASPSSQQFILLWRNTEKPPAPFNLTPFAITLNDLPESLRSVICPTDCRLRPDQRAFEMGKYERANDLKHKQEEFQRATRRAREQGQLPHHQPRWFEPRIEPETGERVWEPVRTPDGDIAYWKERESAWREKRSWKDVDQIFIDDQP